MKFFYTVFLLIFFLLISVTSVKALGESSTVPNNKFGVHILFPSEVEQAARIVNSNGGDWGYVTIPIQSSDKDLQKWQKFMDDCRKFHLIPIIRLATEGDYFVTSSWRTPQLTDVLDFANFLSSLTWPTQTHYIVIYNEVNRDDEWGGQANAQEYAQLLSYAVTVFKSKSPDYFIISAGLDNASINSNTAINEYTFLKQMNFAVPGIFNQIDGLGSHSYPNPAFSALPTNNTRESINGFKYETDMIRNFSSKDLPVFITETGWSRQNLSDDTIGQYFTYAFANVWSDPRVVAVTPFLLFASSPPFSQFSILAPDLKDTPLATILEKIPKIAGKPTLTPDVLAAETVKNENLPTKEFDGGKSSGFEQTFKTVIKMMFPRIFMVKYHS